MLAHLSGKVKEGKVFHPVIVVHHLSGIGLGAFKIKKLCHLLLDALLVMAQCFVVEQVSLLTLSRRVANHSRGAAHQNDGFMTTALQVSEHHNTTEMSYVQRVGCGVGTKIGGNHLLLQQLFCSGHDLCQHATPFQFFNKIFPHYSYILRRISTTVSAPYIQQFTHYMYIGARLLLFMFPPEVFKERGSIALPSLP